LKANVPGSLHICGFGDMAGELTKLAEEHPNLHFDGFLPKETDCLDWSQKVDVLINTRLPIRGQDNSFPSKVFEYGLAGKAILSTITGGVNQVIEKECIYFDTNNFEESLCERIQEMSNMDRAELQRRATTIRNLVTQNYSYNEQARRMVEFMKGLVNSRNAQNTLH
jgi:glycosyltransferase involved in cell wall biosynthesis